MPRPRGINLEDIRSPECFEIEAELERDLDIPVFHDDQHGTAIVVAAALLNAMRVTGKQMGQMKIVINGAGAAGIAIGKLLISMGFGNIVMCDINGIICEGMRGSTPDRRRSPTSPTGITSTAPWPTPCGGRTPSWACPGPIW